MEHLPPTTTPKQTARKARRKKPAPAPRSSPAGRSQSKVRGAGTPDEAPSPEGVQKWIDAIYRVLRSL
jgi:hypothetical protein